MEVLPADPGEPSRFTSAVYLDVVDVKTPRKPFTTLEAVSYVRQHLELSEISDQNFDLYGVRDSNRDLKRQRLLWHHRKSLAN